MDKEAILKALANPVRRNILHWLKDPEQHFAQQYHAFDVGVCAGQIDHKVGLSQSTVSNHLSILQKAELIHCQKVGQWNFYERNEQTIQQFLLALQQEL